MLSRGPWDQQIPDLRNLACTEQRTRPRCQDDLDLNPRSATYTLCDLQQGTETSPKSNLLTIPVSKATNPRVHFPPRTRTPSQIHQQVPFTLPQTSLQAAHFLASPPLPPWARQQHPGLEVPTSCPAGLSTQQQSEPWKPPAAAGLPQIPQLAASCLPLSRHCSNALPTLTHIILRSNFPR